MSKIVVHGASGNIGRLIVEELLLRTDAANLTLVSRNPSSLSQWAASGARIVTGDYRDPASLDAAYAGADTVMLVSGMAILERIPEHRNAIAAAKKAGVGHIVYTSVSGMHPSNNTPSSGDHAQTERDLRACGLGFTFLRNQAYAELMVEMAESALRTGKWVHLGRNGRFSPVSRHDIARAAACILVDPRLHNEVAYEITGPELFSFPEMARLFADIYDRPIEYVEVNAKEMYAIYDELGLPRGALPGAPVPFCYGSDELIENYIAWENQLHAILSHHVEVITGSPARPLVDVIRATRADMLSRLAETA